MTERVETEILYNSTDGTVTIRFRQKLARVRGAEEGWDGAIVLPIPDALRLGSELSNLLRPIYCPIWVAPQ